MQDDFGITQVYERGSVPNAGNEARRLKEELDDAMRARDHRALLSMAEAHPLHHPDCFLAAEGRMRDGGPIPSCNGRLIHAHLIPQQLLKREGHARYLQDPRTWVWACGGITGAQGHHGMLDQGHRPLALDYEALPRETIQLAWDLGLDYWLEREYVHVS